MALLHVILSEIISFFYLLLLLTVWNELNLTLKGTVSHD